MGIADEQAAGTEAVLYEVRESGVAVLTFNRPERMNAWGNALSTGFYRRIEDAEADPAVRVIVVTGTAWPPRAGSPPPASPGTRPRA